MLSRAQSLSQIYIIEKLYEEKWHASRSGLREYNSGLENAINIDHDEDKKYFEIVSVNILSLRKHLTDLKRKYENTSIDCLCLQETWLPEYDDATLYKIGDMVPHLNSVGPGRGIATYCDEEEFDLVFDCRDDIYCMMMRFPLSIYLATSVPNVSSFGFLKSFKRKGKSTTEVNVTRV